MTSAVCHITFDCADPYSLAQFWSQVTSCPIGKGGKPGGREVNVLLPGGLALVFERVPEPKTVKNRVHVCLRPDGGREPEVEHLLTLGARLVDDRRSKSGSGWVVLADPEGNEFCVLRAARRRKPSASAPQFAG